MDSKEVEYFAADKGAGKEHVRKHGDRKGEAPANDMQESICKAHSYG